MYIKYEIVMYEVTVHVRTAALRFRQHGTHMSTVTRKVTHEIKRKSDRILCRARKAALTPHW